MFLRTNRDGRTFSFAIADPEQTRKASGGLEAGTCTESECAKKNESPSEALKNTACKAVSETQRDQDRNERPTYHSVIQRKCAICHSHGEHKINFQNISALKRLKPKVTSAPSMAEAIKLRLQGNDGVIKMPIGIDLRPDEEKAILSVFR